MAMLVATGGRERPPRNMLRCSPRWGLRPTRVAPSTAVSVVGGESCLDRNLVAKCALLSLSKADLLKRPRARDGLGCVQTGKIRSQSTILTRYFQERVFVTTLGTLRDSPLHRQSQRGRFPIRRHSSSKIARPTPLIGPCSNLVLPFWCANCLTTWAGVLDDSQSSTNFCNVF